MFTTNGSTTRKFTKYLICTSQDGNKQTIHIWQCIQNRWSRKFISLCKMNDQKHDLQSFRKQRISCRFMLCSCHCYTVCVYSWWKFPLNVDTHACAGISEASDSDMMSILPTASSSSTSHLCPFPSLVAAAAVASVNITAPPPVVADFHKLYGHLLSLAGSMPKAPSHAYTQSHIHNLRYDDNDVDRKLASRRTAFKRYHPYPCRR